ncbi:uncharacterized protein LOC125758132 [Rhipicephalus sanguineus]|uniref:uncharacterized protein LOC125758132 n=1 Tax=Rhipicephalus sanguineus TaxID=34632 RepID=UPI0020C372D7|nr:uncharacterized protein LOC125758132 [Rhipicephalus sanguineus]
MKYSLVLAITVGCLVTFAIASSVLDQPNSPEQQQPEQQSEQPGTCERVSPLPPWAKYYRGRCWYICKSWPLRIEFEPEGIACGLMTVNNTKRVCKNGTCVKAEPSSEESEQPKRLIPTQDSTSKGGTGVGNLLGSSKKQDTEDTTSSASTKEKSTTSIGKGLLSKKQ